MFLIEKECKTPYGCLTFIFYQNCFYDKMELRLFIFMRQWILTGKTEIYSLSDSVQIFKYFKWDAFKTLFSMKNETIKELFDYYGALINILSN